MSATNRALATNLMSTTTPDNPLPEAMRRVADILTAAPEGDVTTVLSKVKLELSLSANMTALGTQTSTEMLGKTIAYLLTTDPKDERITCLLKEGRKMMILRIIKNLTPTPCSTCTKMFHYLVGEEPKVRCTMCTRPACGECHPQRHPHLHYLCTQCTPMVVHQSRFPDDAYSKRREAVVVVPATQGTQADANPAAPVIQEIREAEEDMDEEEIERMEEERRRKRENEEGGRERVEEVQRRSKEEDKICRLFKYGGKCPHGMNGKKEHRGRKECGYTHPKVCSRLLSHGDRGVQGCDGKECGKYHPKLCYSSTTTKRCTRERCSYWHCEGTSYSAREGERREPQVYLHPRRREEERERIAWREEEARRHREEEHRRRREAEHRREEVGRRRPEEERRERQEPMGFPDISQLIRREIQRAFEDMRE